MRQDPTFAKRLPKRAGKSGRCRAWLQLLAPALLLSVAIPRTCLAESRWGYELGVGPAGLFKYRTLHFNFGNFPERFPTSLRSFAGASRELGQHFSLQAEMAFSSYEGPTGAAQSNGGGLPLLRDSGLVAEFPSLGLGVRYHANLPSAGPLETYVPFLPPDYLVPCREQNE